MTFQPPKFAANKEMVNWEARARSEDISGLVETIFPELKQFVIEGSRKVNTPFKQEQLTPFLYLYVPVSGGIDSCTSAWLAALSMRDKIKENRDSEDELKIIGFEGQRLNQEDMAHLNVFQRKFEQEFSDIPYSFLRVNIDSMLDNLDGIANFISDEQEPFIDLSPCRAIYCAIKTSADYAGAAWLDSTNKDELMLGELAPGEGTQLSVIGDLYKSEVYQLARKIGLPAKIINRDAQNTSLGNSKVGSYFGELPDGFTTEQAFQVLDQVLHSYDLGLNVKNTSEKLGHNEQFVDNVFTHCRGQIRNGIRVPITYEIDNCSVHERKSAVQSSVSERKYLSGILEK